MSPSRTENNTQRASGHVFFGVSVREKRQLRGRTEDRRWLATQSRQIQLSITQRAPVMQQSISCVCVCEPSLGSTSTAALVLRLRVCKQEAQLMLTNPRDALRGQSRSPNIVPFHMLRVVSYCAIVTLSLRRAVFPIFDFKTAVTLKTGLGVRQGHWKCHHAEIPQVVQCTSLGHLVSCPCTTSNIISVDDVNNTACW